MTDHTTKLTKSQRLKKRAEKLESALEAVYEDKIIYKCPMCNRSLRGGSMLYHLSSAHGGGRKFKKSIDPKSKKIMNKVRPFKHKEKSTIRTNEQALRDDNNKGKGILVDAHVPGSHIRKIDK